MGKIAARPPRRAPIRLGVFAGGSALLLALLAALAWSAPAGAASTGAISGTVTEAGTHAPLAGIPVCAIAPPPTVVSEEEPPPQPEEHCTSTGATGEYTVEVPPGSWYVEFNPWVILSGGKPVFSQQNFIAQLWEDAFTEASAKQVTVAAGATVTGIGAALEPGGEISGHVTAAATGAPLAGAYACALAESEKLGSFACGETSATGEYTIYGLAPGAYRVLFFGKGYALAVYGAKEKFSEATIVNVVVGQVATGIDAALQVQEELPSGPEEEGPSGGGPDVSGGRGGGGLLGGLGSGGGETQLTVRSRLLAVRHGAAIVEVACHKATRCHGRLRLFALRLVRRRGHEVLERVPLGGKAFSVEPSKHRTVAIRLDRHGLERLRAGHGHAAADLGVVLAGAGSTEVVGVRLLDSRHS